MTENDFSHFGLSDDVNEAIEAAGFRVPTKIQAEVIPEVLAGRDVIGLAQTGTGKTASFLLPMIEVMSRSAGRARMPRGLIISPTRELAGQTAEQFVDLAKSTRLKGALLIGGSSVAEQEGRRRQNIDMVFCTPGRILDIVERGGLLLTGVTMAVIDEADRMLDMGFIPDIERIFAMLRPQRQTMLFSATMPPEIKRLTGKFMRNAKEIAVDPPSSSARTVEQVMILVPGRRKTEAMRRLLKSERPNGALVFCNQKKDVDALADALADLGVERLHGNLDQSVRTRTVERFKSGDFKILIASDVAARGLDVVDLSHVFNYDPPRNVDDYVHRIGRTGRAGKKGRAFTLVTSNSDGAYEDIVKAADKSLLSIVDWKGSTDDDAVAPRDFPSRRRRSDSKTESKPDAKRRRPARGKPASRPPDPKPARREAATRARRDERGPATKTETEGAATRRTDGGRPATPTGGSFGKSGIPDFLKH